MLLDKEYIIEVKKYLLTRIKFYDMVLVTMTDIAQTDKPQKKYRSTSYPYIGLEEAIKSASDLRVKLGSGPYSREAAAQALGYKGVSGASASKIAAISHFGLLSRTGDTYRQSPLADRIFMPTSDQDKKDAIVEAVKTPKLYAKLISDNTGKSIPLMLSNILFHTHKINEKVTKDVAANFSASLEFAGLLQNGVVSDVTHVPGEVKTSTFDTTIEPADQSGTKLIASAARPLGHNSISVPLPSRIEIHFPAEMAYHFALGEFSTAIKLLEEKAQEIMKGKNGTEPTTSDEGLSTSSK